jgi:hypothetical protein
MARASSLIGRLASPTGFLLVGLCFVLPFLTASCDTQADGQRVRGALSYTGADLVGGRVDLYYEAEARDERGVQRLEETDLKRSPVGGGPVEPIPVQPLAVAAVALLGAGALAGLLRPSGLRRLTAGALALVAAALLVGGSLRATDQMAAQLAPLTGEAIGKTRDLIAFGSGFWSAVSLLLLLGVGNIAASLRTPAPHGRPSPAGHDRQPP